MPLRDRNDLHLAAGFAPPYRELGLDDRELADTMLAIDRILDSHEPLPAVVMDRHWNLLRTNAGAVDLFATMLDLDRIETPANVLEMMFDPQLLRPHVLDWEHLAPALLVRARRESVGGIPDPDLADRLARLAAQLPATATASAASTGPLIAVGFRVGAVEARFFSTVTTIGTPRDVTLQELRVELFHPADDTTRSRYHR